MRPARYSAITISQYVISKFNQIGRTISNLKLQKVLYFVQAEFLVSQNRPCFREQIEAWDFGPVVPVVYHKYKVFGSASIPDIGSDLDETITTDDKRLINGIVSKCEPYSASQLVGITHSQRPWKIAYIPYHSSIISNESIKKFFEEDC